MTLRLEGLEVECVIGERADERDRLQRLSVEVELAVPDRAAETDDLADAVDYAVLAERIRSALVAARCRLVEHAAKVACDVCTSTALVSSARVSVTKRGAVPGLSSATATYSTRGPEEA